MIHVLLECGKEGVLSFCTASGHAEYGAKGHDIVCAAVSILLRTTVLTLEKVKTAVEAPSRGCFSLKVVQYDVSESERLRYAADFLRMGFLSLEKEYPLAVTFKQVQQ